MRQRGCDVICCSAGIDAAAGALQRSEERTCFPRGGYDTMLPLSVFRPGSVCSNWRRRSVTACGGKGQRSCDVARAIVTGLGVMGVQAGGEPHSQISPTEPCGAEAPRGPRGPLLGGSGGSGGPGAGAGHWNHPNDDAFQRLTRASLQEPNLCQSIWGGG